MDCKEVRELLTAHVDRELGVRAAIEIEQHLQGCPACRAAYAAQQAVRSAVRTRGAYFAAPGDLEHRIRAALPSQSARPPLTRARSWWSAGAALAAVVALAWSIGLYLALPSANQRLAEEIVAAHVRSLMLNHATDITSSDHHTVKPWFAGKLDFSPPVQDLGADGFALVGGRLDYLDHRPIAALVYRHGPHWINLFVWPAGRATPPSEQSRRGYHLVSWVQGGMAYWAVSDVEPAELSRFKQLLVARLESPDGSGSRK